MTRARQLLLVSAAQSFDEKANENQGLYDELCHAALSLPAQYVLPQQPSEWSTLNWPVQRVIPALENVPQQNVWRDVPWQNPIAAMAKSIDSPAALLGTAWHGVLEYATEHGGALLDLTDIVARFGVTFSQADDARKLAERLLTLPEYQKWFDEAQYDEAYNEMTLMNPQGQVRRVDRWVRIGRELTVIDYKLDWRDADLVVYTQQVKEYVGLMQALYPQCVVKGVLLSSKGDVWPV